MILVLSVLLNFFTKINVNNTFANKETLEESTFFSPILEVSNTLFPILEEWFANANKEIQE
jgi:membrane protein required for colicin V production